MIQFEKQQTYFATGETMPIDFRITQLRKLRQAIATCEATLTQALQQDLGKSEFESYATEIGSVLSEIEYTIKHLKKWAKPKKVPTPITNFPATSRIYTEPKGVVLIISPWNYPILLALSPIVAALSAGNCVTLKPSELAPHCSAVLNDLLRTFPDELVAVCEGDATMSTQLLNLPFNHIFFTGSPKIGKLVMQAAAEHLTSVTLELGGKSPCIVDGTANIKCAAKRIIWGKCINSGQTCVAPDYLLVHASVKDHLLNEIKHALHELYGEDCLSNADFPKIINERHFKRLCDLIDPTVLIGGRIDEHNCKIEPTLLDATPDSLAMQEEIFGPILPVITFDTLDEAIEIIHHYEKPLALYLFTTDKRAQQKMLSSLSFGGGCINDTIMHLVNPYLPFGGIGNSGMGAYHAKAGFDAFSHEKSVLKKANFYDNSFRYPPYQNKLEMLKKLLK